MEKLNKQKTNKAVYRAVNDFVQVSKDTKERTPIELAIKEAQKYHIKYYESDD